jgi:hypothetical protein
MGEGHGKGKVSEATDREAVRLVVVVHVAVATVEVVQVPGSNNTKSYHFTIGSM